ncbi:MAG: PaaI family thioesterase [Rhodothalassiaceae bacterium]
MSEIPAHAAALSQTLMDHAYQRYMGVELLEQRAGFCRTGLTVTEAIDNLGHTLHGGVIYSMMDVTSMLATLPALSESEYALTTALSVNLMSPAPRGMRVEFQAEILRAGRTAVFTLCHAYKCPTAADHRLIATAQLSKSRFQRELPG